MKEGQSLSPGDVIPNNQDSGHADASATNIGY